MKKLIWASVAAGQIVAVAQPATAAELIEDRALAAQRQGTFAGVRVRVPLGSAAAVPHAGLAFTGVQRSGASQVTRFSTGVELGFAGDEKVRLSVGGKRFSDVQASLARRGQAPGGQKAGVSTIGWVAIGVGALAFLYLAAVAVCIETDCLPSE